MIIIAIKNGLGNQMFQYAFGKVLEWKYSFDVAFDIMPDDFVSCKKTDMEIFTIGEYIIVEKKQTLAFQPFSIAKYRHEKKYLSYIYYKLRRMFHPDKLVTEKLPCQMVAEFENLSPARQYYFMGHWMNLKYFSGFEDRIKALFLLKDPVFYQSDMALEIINSTSAPVSLHIRRGDYLTSGFIQAAEMSYYEKAIHLIAEQVHNPMLYIFTNDPEWVTKEFKPELPYKIVQGNNGADSYKDLVLMSLCKHNITANSSFSWWGAWLNNNPKPLIVCPKQWYAEETLNTYVSEMIPQHWVRL